MCGVLPGLDLNYSVSKDVESFEKFTGKFAGKVFKMSQEIEMKDDQENEFKKQRTVSTDDAVLYVLERKIFFILTCEAPS